MLSSSFGTLQRRRYNLLDSVEKSYSRLQGRQDFVDFLADFAQLAHDCGVEGEAGAFLLHRHFTAGEGEVLLEEPSVLRSGKPALITRATQREGRRPQAVRWALGEDGTFTALEFSADAGAVSAARELAKKQDFIEGYAAVVQRYNLGDLIGLSIADRHYLVPSEEDWLIENTDNDASVVTLEPADGEDDQGFIPTCWVPTVEMYCSPMRRCDPLVSCRRRCRNDGDAGHEYNGHDPYTSSHNVITIGHDDR